MCNMHRRYDFHEARRRLSVMAGTQPELIFFPIDSSFPYLTSPVHKWVSSPSAAIPLSTKYS
jgi:hypothetical protein